MLSKIDLKNILFLDIETVPLAENYTGLTDLEKELFAQKTAYQRQTNEVTPEEFYQKAGIWAEFGKIICISVGYFSSNSFRIKSFYGEEPQILTDFSQLINTHFNKPDQLLCAHNGKEFDFPFIARRMIVNGINLPEKLNLFGKKPWEIPHLDTLELWKFGDYKHYTSLNLLTHILEIPSPKSDIDGSQVAEVYYREKNLPRIVSYCEKDVIAVAQILLKFLNRPLLTPQHIVFTDQK